MTGKLISTAAFLCFVLIASNARANTLWENIGVRIIRSNPTELVITYAPKVTGYDTVIKNGSPVIVPIIDGIDNIKETYTLKIPITVPTPQGFTLASADISYKSTTSKQRSTEPVSWVAMEYAGIARNKHLSHLFIIASRYDAAEGKYIIPSLITAVIRFTEKPERILQTKEYSPVFTLNHKQSELWAVKENKLIKTFSSTNKSESVLQSDTRQLVRMDIDGEGIYRITSDDLSSLGIQVTKEKIPTIQVFGNAGNILPETISTASFLPPEQPIIVRTGANGELVDIIFYGGAISGFTTFGKDDFRHFLNPYAHQSSYILSVGGTAQGKRMMTKPSAEGQVLHTPTNFPARIFNEEEFIIPFGAGSGREWFGKQTDANIPATYTNVLDGLVRQGEVEYRYVVAHKNTTTGTFTVSEGDTRLGTANVGGTGGGAHNYVDAIRTSVQTGRIPTSSISGDNRSALRFSYTNGSSASSVGYVDWFEIIYPRELTASNNSLELFTDKNLEGITEYSINGFNGEIWGMDVTDRQNPTLINNESRTGGMFVLRTLLEKKGKRFLLSSEFKKPRMSPEANGGLLATDFGTDIILITHPDLLNSAQKYKQYRESSGEHKVLVITTTQIYTEFSGGMPDIAALRNFIGFAYNTWSKKPHYVILWGDGHFDAKNIAFQVKDYVPVYQVPQTGDSFHSVISYSTEDFFVRVEGNDNIPDLSIGRVPVVSDISGQEVVEKIKKYETESAPGIWRTISTFVADDGPTTFGASGIDSDGSTHTDDAELVSGAFPEFIQDKKIYMAEYPLENAARGRRKPTVTEQFISTSNGTGNLVLNWVGHGSPRLWANEQVFEKDVHIPMFTNSDKVFFLSGATCDFGRFDDANRQCGAEDFVMKPTGGAIAVFASTRAVYADQNSRITNDFFKNVFSRDEDGRFLTIGDALYNTKLRYTSENDQKFLILGDPALRLAIPEYRIVVNSINNTHPDSANKVQLKALSKVTVKGTVYDPKGENIASDFDGTLLLTLRDATYTDKVKDATDYARPDAIHSINKLGGLLNRSSWQVEKGVFTAEFIVPKDISFTNTNGSLFLYANSGNRHAAGSTRKFIVGGMDTAQYNDSNGPLMKIYADDKRFQPGDMVRNSPMIMLELSDETGVNTTGSGIGHNIEFRIDNGEPIDATDTYQTSFDNPKAGLVQKQVFNLTPGRHSVHARAWDILNNYSETETFFTVADPNSFVANDLLSYPNPSSGEARFVFGHNQSQPFRVEIHIFAADGRLVRNYELGVEQLHTAEFVWDTLDNEGNTVPSGAYYLFVEGYAYDGKKMTINGSHLVIR